MKMSLFFQFMFQFKNLKTLWICCFEDTFLCSFSYKVVCIDYRFTKPIVVYRSENAAYEFIKAILKEYKCCKKVMNKQFNKNLIISEEEEHLFQQSNSY